MDIFYIILHCNRCTVVAQFFNLNFIQYTPERYPWNEVHQQNFFLFEPANYSATEQLGRNFSTVQKYPEKKKNLCLIKSISK